VNELVSLIVKMVSGSANELKGAFLVAGELAVRSTFEAQLAVKTKWTTAQVDLKSQVSVALVRGALTIGVEEAWARSIELC